MKFTIALIAATFLSATAGVAAAAPAEQSPTARQWDDAFAAFAADDAIHPHPPGGVLFVGSSSIRLWSDLEDQFATLPVVI